MCKKKIKALEKAGFFFNYSWGSLLLVIGHKVTSLLKKRKEREKWKNVLIGCTISEY